ncbi:MAG: signal peptidase I [Ilumatobacteraceae bacterium]
MSTSDLDVTGEQTQNRGSGLWAVAEWILVVVIAISAAFLIRTFMFQQYYIDGPSMQTTLMPRERVLVNKMSYRLHDVNRGDVIVFDRVQGNNHDDLIKRVIGLPGETVEIRDCVVFVDGRLLEEPYLDPLQVAQTDLRQRCGDYVDMEPRSVPDDHVLVMGDNRVQSFDGRAFGPIPIDKIRGRAFVAIWPSSAWSWL